MKPGWRDAAAIWVICIALLAVVASIGSTRPAAVGPADERPVSQARLRPPLHLPAARPGTLGPGTLG
jgi:hypothetical protein